METNFITELEKTTKVVKEVLKENIAARDDNKLLIFYVYKKIIEQKANIITEYVCLNEATIQTLPAFETISRASRLTQNKYKELRGVNFLERKKYAKKISKEIKNI